MTIMSFDDCDRDFGSGMWVRLREDGESIVLVLVGEPVMRISEYRGRERRQAVFPVVVSEGLRVLSVGVTLYQHVKANWEKLIGKPHKLTRFGAAGDLGTTYTLTAVRGQQRLMRLAGEVTSAEVEEILAGATFPPHL
jgi:hypothetical protein